MKTLKMSLANIQGKLSRAEMRKVMAGSGPCPDGQQMFFCTQYWGTSTPQGYQCGTNTIDAATKVQDYLFKQTGYVIGVECGYV